MLALATGMRAAELRGLRWEDVDLAKSTLRVRYVVSRVNGKYVLDEPKTRSSRRTITLPALAVRALREHRKRQRKERVAVGRQTGRAIIEGLVFVTAPGHPSRDDPEGLGGRPLSQGSLSHAWPDIAAKAKVDVTMHGLRHGQSSLMVAAGVHPKVIAARLGHATIGETMDRYAHVVEESDREAARLFDEAMG